MLVMTLKIWLISFLMLIPGVGLMFYPVLRLIFVKKKYEKIKAVCVDVNVHKDTDCDGTSITYQPVWEYYYNSQKYTSFMNNSSSFMNIQVGTEKEIYINPDSPEKIYSIFIKNIVFELVSGIIFFITGILCIKVNI